MKIAEKLRAIKSRSLFFLLMGGGASLGLLRSFVVAGLISAVEFGIYATAVAIALFLSPLLGFGRIEETRKLYPRLFSDGRTDEIGPHSERLVAVLALRIAVAVAAAASLVWLVVPDRQWGLLILLAGLIAFNQAGMAVFASALRAGHDAINLALAAFTRAVGSFVLAVCGALLADLPGALLGEGVGGLISLAVAWRMLRRTRSAPRAVEAPRADATSGSFSSDGFRLLLGAMAVSLPVYLSRPVVGAIYDLEQLGTFAFLMLFASGVLAGYGIIDQLVGPSLVRMQRAGASRDQQLRRLFGVMAVVGSLALTFLIAAFSALSHPLLEFYVGKYLLHGRLVFPAIVFAVLQFTSTVDWLLIANDRERAVLRAGLVYLASFAALCIAATVLELSLEMFLWGMAAAKLCQLMIALLFVSRVAQRPRPDAGNPSAAVETS